MTDVMKPPGLKPRISREQIKLRKSRRVFSLRKLGGRTN